MTYIVRTSATEVDSIGNRYFLILQSKISAHNEVEGEEWMVSSLQYSHIIGHPKCRHAGRAR